MARIRRRAPFRIRFGTACVYPGAVAVAVVHSVARTRSRRRVFPTRAYTHERTEARSFFFFNAIPRICARDMAYCNFIVSALGYKLLLIKNAPIPGHFVFSQSCAYAAKGETASRFFDPARRDQNIAHDATLTSCAAPSSSPGRLDPDQVHQTVRFRTHVHTYVQLHRRLTRTDIVCESKT